VTIDGGGTWTRSLPSTHHRSLLLGDVNDVIDSDGRPIGEIRASEPVRRAVTTRYVPAPYPGSRKASGLPINASALRQVSTHWPEVLGVADTVRRAHERRWPSAVPGLFDLARLSAVGLQLPAFIHHRAGPEAPTTVPAFVAASHKVLAGIFGLSKNLLLDEVAGGTPYDQVPADPVQLAAIADGRGMLVGRSGSEVCAGSPAMIDELLHLLVTGAPTRSSVAPTPIRSLVPDTDRYLDYAGATIDLTLWLLCLSLRSRELVRSLGTTIDRASGSGAGAGAAAADAYDVAGASDRIVRTAVALDAVATETMVAGASRLFLTIDVARAAPGLVDGLRPPHGDEVDGVTAWIARTGRLERMPEALVADLSALGARCLLTERDAIAVFTTLERAVLRALGHEQPPAGTGAATVRTLFGALPSEWFGAILGIDPASAPGGCLSARS
jgi:hypothetical protein